jgi:hypothetical protein
MSFALPRTGLGAVISASPDGASRRTSVSLTRHADSFSADGILSPALG